MSELYGCPADSFHGRDECGRYFQSENGAVMHGLNKTDSYHACISSKPEGYDVLESVRVAEASSGDDGITGEVRVTAREPEPEPKPDPSGSSSPEPEPLPELERREAEEPEEPAMAECPDCGHVLGPAPEVDAAIDANGSVFCGDCGSEVIGDE